ncbi:nuclear transport factor 2 family protein [Actinomadura roseirufa]|uniref:nuclear transport factor 2 family protein n=1 Tax=Actinomadura roseirufa TaxID=2094049 RepID=UPI0010417E68|nr:nuclear transport factor 2 family protein [Actinomadura roseirufa]
MYHAIVRSIVRKTWRRMNAGDYEAAVSMAAPDLRFRFAGDTALGADVRGPEEFRAWFARFAEQLPGVRLRLVDVVAGGWPWNTKVAVRLEVTGTLADGTPYNNIAMQWATLRWGRMVDDLVVEDTLNLDKALRRQQEHRLPAVGLAGD